MAQGESDVNRPKVDVIPKCSKSHFQAEKLRSKSKINGIEKHGFGVDLRQMHPLSHGLDKLALELTTNRESLRCLKLIRMHFERNVICLITSL